MIKTAKEYRADYVFVNALTLYGIGKELYYKVLGDIFQNCYQGTRCSLKFLTNQIGYIG